MKYFLQSAEYSHKFGIHTEMSMDIAQRALQLYRRHRSQISSRDDGLPVHGPMTKFMETVLISGVAISVGVASVVTTIVVFWLVGLELGVVSVVVVVGGLWAQVVHAGVG